MIITMLYCHDTSVQLVSLAIHLHLIARVFYDRVNISFVSRVTRSHTVRGLQSSKRLFLSQRKTTQTHLQN